MMNEKLTARSQFFYAVLMATSAALMGVSSQLLSVKMDSPLPTTYALALLLFSGTFLAYSISFPAPVLDIGRKKLFHKKISFHIGLAFLLFVSLFVYIPLPDYLYVQYGLAGALTLFYYTGFTANSMHFGGARTILLIKNIVLSLAWAFATAPFFPSEPGSLYIFIQRFFYLMALSLVIDIRDIQSDSKKKVLTVPAKAGVGLTKIIAGILLVAGTAFIYKCRALQYISASVLTASMISSISTIFAIGGVKKNSTPTRFLLFIDGNLLLHGLLFYLASI